MDTMPRGASTEKNLEGGIKAGVFGCGWSKLHINADCRGTRQQRLLNELLFD